MKRGNLSYSRVCLHCFITAILSLCVAFAANAASISGVVMESGGTPINGTTTPIWVNAYTGDPCGSRQWIGSGQIGADGTYSITDLVAGTYYIQTSNNNQSDYVNEWWTGNVPDPSSPECSNSQSVTVSEEDTLTSIDFKLDLGGSISGTVRDSNGDPITGITISVGVVNGFGLGPCGYVETILERGSHPANGTYIIRGIPIGEYFLRTSNMNQSNYVNEWWTGDNPDSSHYDCAPAQPITIEKEIETTGKDFHLELGGGIAGVVMDNSGTPISGVSTRLLVQAWTGDPCGPNLVGQTEIESNGQYRIMGLPIELNSYSLRTNNNGRSNYVNEWWTGDEPDPSSIECLEAVPVSIISGTTVEARNFKIALGGSVSGIVRDASGTPITGVKIRVNADMDGINNSERYHSAITDTTNGAYVLKGLPPGDYLIQTNNLGLSNYVDEWWNGDSPDPSHYDKNLAQPLAVTEGEEISGNDFRLELGGSISGTVRDSSGNPLTAVSIDVQAVQGDPCSIRWVRTEARTNSSDGTYVLRGVPTGQCFLHTNNINQSDYVNEWWTGGDPDPSNNDCATAQLVTVTSGVETPGKDFRLGLGGSISGTVRGSSGNPLTAVSIDVQAHQGDPCGNYQQKAGRWTNSSDGTYILRGLPAGQYYLKTWNISQSNYVNEWWTGGTPDPSSNDCTLAQDITVTSGGEITGKDFGLELGGSISGIVRDSNGDPITGVSIDVQVQQGDPCDSYQWKAGGWTDASNGTYTFRGVPVGQYYLKTWNMDQSDYMNEWWADPASAFSCFGAQVLTVSPGGSLTNKDFQLNIDSDDDNMADDWEITHFLDLSHDGTGDTDSDGLSDRDEYFRDTIPTDQDSDDDYISDGYEVNTAGTDPTNPSDTPALPITAVVYHILRWDGVHKTALNLSIGNGFVGTLPEDIETITILDPSAVTIAEKDNLKSEPEYREFCVALDGMPDIGVYTFSATVKDSPLAGTDTDVHSVNRNLPIANASTFSPGSGSIITTTTPSFSWAPVEYEETTIYYRLMICDDMENIVYFSGRRKDMLAWTIPAGILEPGRNYQYRVELHDSENYYDTQNRSHSEWVPFVTAGTLAHSAMPAIGPEEWNAMTWTTDNGTTFLCSVRVIDHDGVSSNGSSHQVSVTYPQPDGRTVPLQFDGVAGPKSCYYYAAQGGTPPNGEYTIKVTDPDGNVGTYVDTLNVQPLPVPNKNSITPSLKNPIQEHITATFDNVFVNGVPYDDFDSYSSLNDLDLNKWWQPSGSYIWIQDGKLQTHISDVIGRGDCRLPFNNPSTIQSVQADITVSDASTDEAPTSRIMGVFFSRDGHDVSVAIAVNKNKVHYWVSEDAWRDGNYSWNDLVEEDMLAVTTGQIVKVSMAWDGSTMTFYAEVEGSGVTRTYTPSGSIAPASSPFLCLNTRINLKVDNTSPTFTWDPVPGANRYRFRIYSYNNNWTVWKGYTGSEPTYTVPPGVLNPDSMYRFRLEAWDAHSPFEIDNLSKIPASSSDHYIFYTGNQESPEPFIELADSGVAVWNDSYIGPHLSFWIKIHDAQGVPEDIRSVKVRFPSGAEEVLYYDIRNSGNTATGGYYRTSSYLPIVAGNYEFIVEDREGHVTTLSEELTPDAIGYPDETSLSPLNNTVLNDTEVVFDWDDVPETGFYRVEIYDKDYNRIYAFPTTQSHYYLPPGLLEEGNLYRYRVTTRREFFDQNVDNGSASPWSFYCMPTFVTTPVAGGSETPVVDLDDMGVAVIHFKDHNSQDAYFLTFQVKVGDADGVPGNIQSVVVTCPAGETFPDGTTTRELRYDEEISDSEAIYSIGDIYGDTGSIPQGTYTFTVTDFDGHSAQIIDDLSIDTLPIPTNCTPEHDSTVGGTTPTIDWDDVTDAQTYWVRLRDSSNVTIYVGDYVTASTYNMPGGVLDLGRTYYYAIYACREVVSTGWDADNISLNGFLRDELPHFTTLPDTDGDGLSDETEALLGTDPYDLDSDDDGLSDGEEDADHDGEVDPGETDPCNPDTDGDGIPDGVESGVTDGVDDPDGAGPLKGTDPGAFVADQDPGTTTDPLNPDSDGDGLTDGQEDVNGNGMVDGGERDPLLRDMTFAADSDQITNLYSPFMPYEKKIYAGTGTFETYLRYTRILSSEVVDGVACRRIRIKGFGHAANPEEDTEWYEYWLAQDTSEVVWVFKKYDALAASTTTLGQAGAVVWMPPAPVVGQTFRNLEGDICKVEETNFTVPLLSTGLGPYDNCLKVVETLGGTDEDALYFAPNVGCVQEEWNDNEETNGWDYKQVLPAGDFDLDADVDGEDLSVFAEDFGRNDCDQAAPCKGDFDGDGDVDEDDLEVFVAEIGWVGLP